MAGLLTPARQRGAEYLDAPGVDPRLVARSLADVVRANRLFGGARAVLAEMRPALEALPVGARVTVLDVGAGAGDIAVRVAALGRRLGREVQPLGLDASETLAHEILAAGLPAVRADARRLPVPDRAVDIAFCSQLLHHFAGADALAVLGEMDRVARVRAIVSDLRRSWLAAAGIWAASFPLGFHPVSRHDGVVSVLRGFTADDLGALVRSATHADPLVRKHRGFRITASWAPG